MPINRIQKKSFDGVGAGSDTIVVARVIPTKSDMLAFYDRLIVDLDDITLQPNTPAGSTTITFGFTLASGVPWRVFA